MVVDILCKVVDNFGDIGVVWRLAKSLKAHEPQLDLRIIVDNLPAFAAIHPGLDTQAHSQQDPVATIIHWDHPNSLLSQPPADMCIEAFACGRPDWYDAILHNGNNKQQRLHISLEYLSAEPYTIEFHLLPSLSPIPQVKKIFFMPGFDIGTGGLILDPAFMAAKDNWDQARVSGELATRRQQFLQKWLPDASPSPNTSTFWISLFSYQHDYAPLIRDIELWHRSLPSSTPKPLVLVASGMSSASFFNSWNAADRPFPAYAVPFICQEDWDNLLLACDFNIVRGEESLARAALSGQPFLWHAYLQEEGYQHVKSSALVERMQRHFAPLPAWNAWSLLMTTFNQRNVNSAERHGQEDYFTVLTQLDELQPGFTSFAESLEKLGDCAKALLSLYDKTG